MIKIILTFTITFFLFGCSTMSGPMGSSKENVVIKTEYVSRKAPNDLFEIPLYPRRLNSTATQKDVASWLVESEGRIEILENNIRALKKFQDAPLAPTGTSGDK